MIGLLKGSNMSLNILYTSPSAEGRPNIFKAAHEGQTKTNHAKQPKRFLGILLSLVHD